MLLRRDNAALLKDGTSLRRRTLPGGKVSGKFEERELKDRDAEETQQNEDDEIAMTSQTVTRHGLTTVLGEPY